MGAVTGGLSAVLAGRRRRSRDAGRPRRRRRVALVAALALGAFALTPTGCYLSRAGYEEARILGGRRSIERIVAAGGVDAATRGKLGLVLAARRFAADSLDLDAGKSFTQYSDIGRDTLLLLLTGARRDRLEPYTWWFPIVGRVPYKGFFDVAMARRAREELERRGYDVYLRPSSAFSTLGWFDDPLLNTTLVADSVDLANTVIHEVTHNEFYARGQAVFNESFATFVGARGSERFFRARGDTAGAARALRRWADDQILGRFWASLAGAIDSAYARHPGETAADSVRRVAARDAVYARARQVLVDSVAPRLVAWAPGRAEEWARRTALDNAALLARRTYARELPLFDQVLVREGGDVRQAIRRIIALAKAHEDDPFEGVRRWVARPP